MSSPTLAGLGPLLRIAARYIIGTFFGVVSASEVDSVLANDPALMQALVDATVAIVQNVATWVSVAAMAAVEWLYKLAKKRGWST